MSELDRLRRELSVCAKRSAKQRHELARLQQEVQALKDAKSLLHHDLGLERMRADRLAQLVHGRTVDTQP